MRSIAPALSSLVLLLLAGCGGADSGDPVEAGKGGWSIPAGIYGNVVKRRPDSTDMAGLELRLDDGSESKTVEIVLCNGRCEEVQVRPLVRGLNGISFTVRSGHNQGDVMIQPAGKDAVTLDIDWGDGVLTDDLPRLDHEVGLAAARQAAGDAGAPIVPAPPVPLPSSSPPPLPSPTP